MARIVDARAREMERFLLQHEDENFTLDELMGRFRLPSLGATRQVLAEVAKLVARRGLCLRVPVHEHGFTTRLTDDPGQIIASAVWLGRVTDGVAKRRNLHLERLEARMDRIAPGPERDGLIRWIGRLRAAEAELAAAEVELQNVQRLRRNPPAAAPIYTAP